MKHFGKSKKLREEIENQRLKEFQLQDQLARAQERLDWERVAREQQDHDRREGERRRQEEERRRQEQRKQQEEERRRQEEEHKRQEERQRLEDERRRLEEEFRRLEERKRREERERREQERIRQEKESLAQQLRERERRGVEQKELKRKEREDLRMAKLKLTSPEALRWLRDLIRTRYDLDMEIWSLRRARRPDRPVVEEKMKKADAILTEIYTMVRTWEENDKLWTPEEWELAQDIKERILADGKRMWMENPPWNEN